MASEYPWQQAYRSALLEPDKGILLSKISEAEHKIFLRYQELAVSYNPDERTAMRSKHFWKCRKKTGLSSGEIDNRSP